MGRQGLSISRVEAIPLRIPFRHALAESVGRYEEITPVLVKLYTDAGITGIGEVDESVSAPHDLMAVIRHDAADGVHSRNCILRGRVTCLHASPRRQGNSRGLFPRARGGVAEAGGPGGPGGKTSRGGPSA